MERDIREEDEFLFENRAEGRDLGLFRALEEADRRFEESRGGGLEKRRLSEEMAVCPVCYKFEGDEAAVARHVEEHFKD